MAYVTVTLLMLLLMAVMFFSQITIYHNRYKNLKSLRTTSTCSEQAKTFYQAYMALYQAGEQPHIQAIIKNIEFDPATEPNKHEKMTFNLSPLAVKDLRLEAEQLKFSAKFAGQIIQLTVPFTSITAIVAAQSEPVAKR